MLVGVHGTLDLHPWTAAARDSNELVDAFSLLATRSAMLGMASFGSGQGAPATPRWGHADADDTWDHDGPERDLLWYHVTVPPTDDVAPHRLPIQALLDVVDSSLRRLGTANVRAVRGFLPLQLARASWRELTSSSSWFQLAPPPTSPITVDISVEAGERARITDHIDEITETLAEAVGDQMQVGPRSEVSMPPRFPTWETFPTHRRSDTVGFRCSVREWSIPLAAWLLEAITNASLEVGIDDPLLIDLERRT